MGLNISLNNRFWQWAWLILLLATPIVLWIIPAGIFDNGKVILCPSRFLFDIECFGCGMTRAVMHMHHLEVDEAVYHNVGVLAIYPALIGVWVFWVYKAAKKLEIIPLKKKQPQA
jgi:hypothetical protein